MFFHDRPFPARVSKFYFFTKNGPKMEPECVPKSIERGTKKNLENTPRQDNKNDSQMAPSGAPGGLVRPLLGPKGSGRIKGFCSWRPLRSNFGFLTPPGSPRTTLGYFDFLNRFGERKGYKNGARILHQLQENAKPKTRKQLQKPPNRHPKQKITKS